MKVLVVFGTRPEAIKLAPVIVALRSEPRAEVVAVSTGQHRQMLDQTLDQFSLRPDEDLDLMRPEQTLPDLTARALQAVGGVLRRARPSVLVVQGDTTTVLAAALAAYYEGVPVAHVEAGLRTGDPRSPFPEEMNRRLCDALSDVLFPPTETAKRCLLSEGFPADRMLVTGNTVIDALLQVAAHVRLLESAPGVGPELAQRLATLCGSGRRVVLVTGHRRESFGDGIRNVALALRALAERNRDVEVIYPVHLNPNVQRPVHELLQSCDRVHLVPPLPYSAFVWLMQRCYLVLTDSGGIQEEAPALGKPVLVTRDTTERPEAVEAGTARLVGTRTDTIVKAAEQLLHERGEYEKMARAVNPFGDGKASGRIVRALMERYA
ncbi:MAG: UDP-N-acetylglucosamine 2-epimerase (non-hydrolyzing) [SAR202 cluster bacterium]|nr:UDP-N-acetylglucosamine 2-epimerase (non-hydrolyzing) [SAR202 cluster bacterium]